jgi:hypothetical protein
MNLPQARKDNLLTTELEEEVVVYDPERKQAHSLNRTAVAVWTHSDGQTSLTDLRRRVSADVGVPVSEAAIWLALRKLERAHLLAEKLGTTEPMTRRQVLGKAGRFGAAAMVATPIILSATVLPAAAAATGTCGTAPGSPPCATGCTCLTLSDSTHKGCVFGLASGSGGACTVATGCVPGTGKCVASAPGSLTGTCQCAVQADCAIVGGVNNVCIANNPSTCFTPCTPSNCFCP